MAAMNMASESLYEKEIATENIVSPNIGQRIYGFVEKNELLVLGIVLVAVAFSSLLHSYHKQFWFDEIFTIIVSTQPDLHHFAAAMPAEGNPPLNTFLTRLVIKAFGVSEISVRLVPLSGFLVALIGVYVFVRREAGRVFGILAVLLVMFGPVWHYSYEARPYGILLGAFMVALVGWQTATRIEDSNLDQSRVPALILLALGILGCAFSHYIGLIEIGVPLLVGEAVRIYIRRRIDWAILLTGLCCLTSLIFILPMMRRVGHSVITKSTVLQPPLTLHKIHFYFDYAARTWPQVMDYKTIALVLLVAFVTWSPFQWKHSATYVFGNSVNGVRTYVFWACVTASLLIPITWLAMFYGRGWYYCRYGIASALGVVLWFCLLSAKRRLRSPEFVAAVILAVTVQYLLELRHGLRVSADTLGGSELIEAHPSDLPVVVSSGFCYPAIWWYASAADKPRVVFLTSPINATEINAAAVLAEKPYFHAPILDSESFTSRTPHFLLEVDEDSVGVPQRDSRKMLESEGFNVKMIDSKDHFMLFDVSRPQQPANPL